MHKAKIGVIGAGWWATEYHIPHLKEREDVELTSVCKIEENELDFLKNKFGFKYASTNYLEALDFEKLGSKLFMFLKRRNNCFKAF